MPLHRFITPTYFGGLPGTHDLINVVSGGTGAGGSAPVDGPKAGGPNVGTLFVAFGEDGTSFNTNRGLKALAENTDFLDDVIHRGLATPVVQATQPAPGAPLASLVLAGDIFVGQTGTTNTQLSRSGAISVLDQDGTPLHVLDGGSNTYVPVLVTAITDGAINVVGVPVDGFQTGPTVEFTPSIPVGQQYRLAYYVRGNLKTQLVGALSRVDSGVRGPEDLWAFAKTTRLGDVLFTGAKEFAGTVEFQAATSFLAAAEFFSTAVVRAAGTISFDVPSVVDAPRVTLPEIPGAAAYYQYLEVDETAGTAKWREYQGNSNSILQSYNARWDDGSSTWIPDDVNSEAHLTTLNVATGVKTQTFKTTLPLPASWANGDWYTGIAGEYNATLGPSFGTQKAFDPLVGGAPSFFSGDSTLFTGDHYDYVMKYVMSASARGEFREYASAVDADDILGGVSFTQNAVWNVSTERWNRDVSTAGAMQQTRTPNGLLRVRTKHYPAPADWEDQDWDTSGSLRGLQYGSWDFTDFPSAASMTSLAVIPAAAGRDEVWVGGLSFATTDIGYSPHPRGPWAEATTAVAFGPGQIVWDESDGKAYALVEDGPPRTVESSADGRVWAPEAAIPDLIGSGTSGPNRLVNTRIGAGFIGFKSGAEGVIQEAATIGGAWTARTPRVTSDGWSGGVYCESSGLWVLVGITSAIPDDGIYTSSDRISWTKVVLSGPATAQNGNTGFTCVACNQETGVIVAFGDVDDLDGDFLFARSVDGGLTWARSVLSVLPNGFTGQVSAVHFAGGRFVAFGGNTSADPAVTAGVWILLGDEEGQGWRVVGGAADAAFGVQPTGASAVSEYVGAIAYQGGFIAYSDTLGP